MSRERIKKPVAPVKLEPEKPKAQAAFKLRVDTRTDAEKVADRAKSTQRLQKNLEITSAALAENNLQRADQAAVQEQTRVQREADQVVQAAEEARVQRALEVQAKRKVFFSSFMETPAQRASLEGFKNAGVKAVEARASYQAAIVPEMVQRLVDSEMSVQAQTARASQQPNALQARAEWFNTELPLLRAKYNHPDTPFLDGANVFKPTDQQSFALGKTYAAQRLSNGLTPRDAANALMNIQRKPDRDLALQGLLTGVNPRSSEYASIQRLVAEKEHDLELQRQALFQNDGLQARAFQLAKEEANLTKPNSGISERINAKRGAGEALPEHVRRQLEAGLNTNLEFVRVHTDGEADKLAKSVNAIAFTTGKDIFFSSGSYQPNTKTGYELLAHEVTHTVQQASGLVSPGVDKDQSLETAAQESGAKLAEKFDPNFNPNAKPKAGSSFKNLQNGPQANSPLISSQPVIHRLRLEAMQRQAVKGSTLKVGNLEGLQRAAPMFGSPTLQRSADGTIIQRSWWNPFDWAKDAASWLGEKFMDGLEWMGEKAAKAFMEVFAVAAKPFGETGKQVLEAIKSIGSSLLNVIKDPGAFARNLIEGIKLGFGNFITNAPKHLSSVLGSFLTGKTGNLNLTFPTKLEPLPILMAFISSLNLGWDSIKAKIAKQLGPKGNQALATAEKSVPLLSSLSKGLHNSDEFTKEVLPTLKTEAVDGIKTAAQEGLIRAGINVLLKLIPGAGTVLAIFDTVKVLVSRAGDIASLASNVMGAFGAIAGGNLASAASAIEKSLVGGIKVALDFVAKLAKIDTFIDRVREIIGRVTTKISSVVDPIIKKAVGFVRPFLDKLTGNSSSTAVKPGSVKPTTAKPINGTFGKASFTAGKEQHSVWVDVKNSSPKLMIASTPREADAQLDAAEKTARKNLGTDKNNIFNSKIAPHLNHARTAVKVAKAELQSVASTVNLDDREMKFRSTNIVNRVDNYIKNLFDEMVLHGINPDEVYDDTKSLMPKTTVQFDSVAKSGRKYNVGELRLQLAEQETALKQMTVEKWLARYPYYPGADKAGKDAIKPLDKKARDEARNKMRQDIIDYLTPRLRAEYIKEGLTRAMAADKADIEAAKGADGFLNNPQQNPLHIPDKIVGGHYKDDISAFGDGAENQFIGSQWNNGGKLALIKTNCDQVKPQDRKTTYLNIALVLK